MGREQSMEEFMANRGSSKRFMFSQLIDLALAITVHTSAKSLPALTDSGYAMQDANIPLVFRVYSFIVLIVPLYVFTGSC